MTLGALVDRYEALRQREGHRIKRLAPSMRALRVGLADYLSLPAAQFSKADLRAARDAIADRGTQIAAIGSWAISAQCSSGRRRKT